MGHDRDAIGHQTPDQRRPDHASFQLDGIGASLLQEAQAKEIIDVDMDGDDITVAFNPSYLIEGLSAISEPYVRMKLTTAVKPVEFNGQQEADSDESMDYRYLLVPMRFNN